jgi:hypothetical protein
MMQGNHSFWYPEIFNLENMEGFSLRFQFSANFWSYGVIPVFFVQLGEWTSLDFL